ncbi:MAG: hypothetical protein N2745_06575 [Syntrophorhabdaceae bacterium]|nr:hypothetical protein [Syntrophorhabdaceae bacterium]
MAKIKSAIELAMEKTANLTMDEEEKRSFEKNEIRSRIKGLVNRYLEGMVRDESLMKELANIKGEDRLKKSTLLEELIGELSIEKDNKGILRLIETIFSQGSTNLSGQMEDLEKALKEEKKKREESIKKDLLLRIKAMGISGDALKINIEAWEEGKRLFEELNILYREKAQKLLENVKKTD